MLKQILFVVAVVLLSSTPVVAEEAASGSFLSAHAAGVITKSKHAEAAPLAAMKYLPQLVHPGDPKFYRPLTDTQLKSLLGYVMKAPAIDPRSRLETCVFEPGLSFNFFSEAPQATRDPRGLWRVERAEKETLTILLCFNCDVWAIAKGSNGISESWQGLKPDQVILFGDARPSRKELQTLQQALFPEKDWPRLYNPLPLYP